MDVVDDFTAAVEAAEAEALRQHRAGECHLSEWSCSHCEAEAAYKATTRLLRAVGL